MNEIISKEKLLRFLKCYLRIIAVCLAVFLFISVLSYLTDYEFMQSLILSYYFLSIGISQIISGIVFEKSYVKKYGWLSEESKLQDYKKYRFVKSVRFLLFFVGILFIAGYVFLFIMSGFKLVMLNRATASISFFLQIK